MSSTQLASVFQLTLDLKFWGEKRVNDEGYLQLLNSSFYFWDNDVLWSHQPWSYAPKSLSSLLYCSKSWKEMLMLWNLLWDTMKWYFDIANSCGQFFFDLSLLLQLLAPLAFLRKTNLTALFSLLSWDWGVISKSWFRFPKNNIGIDSKV